MASILRTKVSLHAAGNLADTCSFQSSDRSDKRTVAGEVRVYANGRRRLVSRPARDQGLGMTARLCPAATVRWLDEHAGTLVLVLDARGRKLYATYFTLDVVDRRVPSVLADVPLQFSEVTYSEAV